MSPSASAKHVARTDRTVLPSCRWVRVHSGASHEPPGPGGSLAEHELLAAGVPIDASHEVVHAESGKVLQCDMVCSAWNLVIEFDGNRFHKLPSSAQKDERKTRMLAEAGWTVVRVREGLSPIGEHDVVVPLLSNGTTRAKATLEKLQSLGLKAAEHDAYLKTDQPWGSDAAATYIKRRRIDKSLAALYPEVAAQWHPEKNGLLTPADVTPGSGHKAWCLCPRCEHTWAAAIYSRARGGHGCPECGKRRTAGRS